MWFFFKLNSHKKHGIYTRMHLCTQIIHTDINMMQRTHVIFHIFVGYSFVRFYGKLSLKYRTYRILVGTHAENGKSLQNKDHPKPNPL